MKKMGKRILLCLAVAAVIWCAGVITDRKTLNEELIRLHVIANSDSREDQSVKLRVRDAILDSLSEELEKCTDAEEARNYLRKNLPKLRQVANQVLEEAGVDTQAVVQLCRESFPTRYYDTFRLPAGVYETLKIIIGEGEGQNWWCVSFPGLCMSSTGDEFAQIAVEAGFSESLTESLESKDSLEIRFWLLDILGRLHNRIFPD